MSGYAGVIPGKYVPEYRAGWFSESVKVGRLVAYQAVAQDATGDGSDGDGFGYAVKYPTATTSLVAGIAYSQDGDKTTFATGEVGLILRRGYYRDFMSYETGTAGDVFVPHTSLGIGASLATAIVADWVPGVCGVYCETDGGTATTTSDVFVNAWF